MEAKLSSMGITLRRITHKLVARVCTRTERHTQGHSRRHSHTHEDPTHYCTRTREKEGKNGRKGLGAWEVRVGESARDKDMRRREASGWPRKAPCKIVQVFEGDPSLELSRTRPPPREARRPCLGCAVSALSPFPVENARQDAPVPYAAGHTKMAVPHSFLEGQKKGRQTELEFEFEAATKCHTVVNKETN